MRGIVALGIAGLLTAGCSGGSSHASSTPPSSTPATSATASPAAAVSAFKDKVNSACSDETTNIVGHLSELMQSTTFRGRLATLKSLATEFDLGYRYYRHLHVPTAMAADYRRLILNPSKGAERQFARFPAEFRAHSLSTRAVTRAAVRVVRPISEFGVRYGLNDCGDLIRASRGLGQGGSTSA